MEYDKEFEEAYRLVKPQSEGVFSMHDVALAIWQAARKDHYRIGEEVQATVNGMMCIVQAVSSNSMYHFSDSRSVRRIPAKSRMAEDGLNSLYETFEKFAYALQQTSNVLKKAVEDGTNRAIKECEAER